MLGLHEKRKVWQSADEEEEVLLGELQLGSHFTSQRSGGQGGLTSSCPNTAEGAVELVQLRLVGVQHLEVGWGLEPHLTFSCQESEQMKT